MPSFDRGTAHRATATLKYFLKHLIKLYGLLFSERVGQSNTERRLVVLGGSIISVMCCVLS